VPSAFALSATASFSAISFLVANCLSVGPGCYILWQNVINSVEIWLSRKNENKKVS
jgi:hypothetical protein